MTFLGIEVSLLNLEQAKKMVQFFLDNDRQNLIFTPNPEMVVKSFYDDYFKEVINKGDLNICDGFGLSLFSGAPRIAGVDFMHEICGLISGIGGSVYLLGSGVSSVIERTKDVLCADFPGLRIVGSNVGPKILEKKSFADGSGLEINIFDNNELLREINNLRPDVIFVAFGHGKQEKWLVENIKKISSIKIGMGVGGSFEYIAGLVPRAPCWMRIIGLEWLYRVIIQPRRVVRVFSATVLFFCLYLWQKTRDLIGN